jgi:hypothetical protein
MRVFTKIVWDANFSVLEQRSFEYDGPVARCKGDKVAKQAEADNAAFNRQLMTIFTAQFAKQTKTLDFLQGKLQPMIDNPTGASKGDLAAERTSATDNIATQFNNAQKALQTKQFALGGRDLPSGVNEMQGEALASDAASQTADAQSKITQQDELLKQNNYWNALNVLNGQSANQENPLGYAGAATSSAGSVAGLSEAVTQANQSQLLGALGGIAGGVGTALACPVLGSQILMADGTLKNVEYLRKGDKVAGIDGKPCTVLTDAEGQHEEAVEVRFSDARVSRVSTTHTYAIDGGYVYAADMPDAKSIGTQVVFPVIINASHSYCADGVWALS